MQEILNEIAATMSASTDRGHVANYIPELASVDPAKFGISLILQDGSMFSAGCADELFSIQSISKIFTLTICTGQVG